MVDIIDIETKEQFDQIVRDNELVLVDFWANWCAPCKFFGKGILPKVAEVVDDISIIKVDVEKQPELSTQFGISTVPTILIFKNKDVVKKYLGIQQKDILEKDINNIKNS